jgi:hypothetical protein
MTAGYYSTAAGMVGPDRQGQVFGDNLSMSDYVSGVLQCFPVGGWRTYC